MSGGLFIMIGIGLCLISIDCIIRPGSVLLGVAFAIVAGAFMGEGLFKIFG